MTRIEKTQINCSAFITLSSTLEKVKSDKIIEISEDGQGIMLRDKKEDERQELTIDLSFLNQLFQALMTDYRPIVLTGDAEKYMRTCSYACHYYKSETQKPSAFDPFELFHDIHFPSSQNQNTSNDILQMIFKLFSIDKSLSEPFVSSNCKEHLVHELPPKKTFNQIFRKLSISPIDNDLILTLETGKIEQRDSMDALYTVKDLLFAKGHDTKLIPEYSQFSIEQNGEVQYKFSQVDGQKINITFRYENFKLEFIRDYKLAGV